MADQLIEERARAVLESITDPFYVLDREWRFVYINQSALDYFGCRHGDLLGHVIWEVFSAARGSEFQRHYERAVRERRTVEVELVSPVTGRWVDLRAYPTPDEGLSICFRDITARRQAQARDQFLLELDDATRALGDPDQIARTAAERLGLWLGVHRCAYADIDVERNLLNVIGEFLNGAPGKLGTFPLDAFGAELSRCMTGGMPFVVSDVTADPRLADARGAFLAAEVSAMVAVPLRKDTRVVAALAVQQTEPRQWQPHDVDLVSAVANRCWEALARARSMRVLVRQTEWLNLLAESGTRFLSEEHPEALIEPLFREVSTLLGFDACFHHATAGDGRLRLAVCHGLASAECAGIQVIEPGEHVCGMVALVRRPIVCSAVQAHSDPMTEWIRSRGLRNYACFPLISGEDLVGTLSFGSRARDAFMPEELEFLRALSVQVSAALGRARALSARRESDDRLSTAIAIAGLGTFDLDLASGRVVMNEPGRTIFGWTSTRPLTLAAVAARLHPEDRERVVATMSAAVGRPEAGPFELEARLFPGGERWIRVRGRANPPDASPSDTRIVGAFLDITERKAAEAQRERLLEHERAAREEAERVGRMKDEFLATLSHELRTPLNAILGWSHLLQRHLLPAEHVATAIETIDRNAHAQARLIDDLLDMSRIISGRARLEVQSTDMALVVSAAIESARPAALGKGIQVAARTSGAVPPVLGDPMRLQQVVWNLLSNAVKFTPPGGRVEVLLSGRAGGIELTVRDTGPGISPGFLPHVFERFRQEDASSTRRHGGLGIGLSIARNIVELHGGTIEAVASEEGYGATFVVWLPGAARREAVPTT